MLNHFAAFSFVDRISEFSAGTRARGAFEIPQHVRDFRACLVAEAVGQLAAWVAMSKVDFRGRPVAALATETQFHRDVRPGQTLQLGVDIEDCDDDAVAYGGWARVDGNTVIELNHCLGPMLPVEQFDSPDALRERLEVLRGRGAVTGRFNGVDAIPLRRDELIPGKSSLATLAVPERAAFFADHFPRRPVFPATLLLDTQMRMAVELGESIADEGGGAPLAPVRMTNVKMRAFITPGQTVQLNAEVISGDPRAPRIGLSATVDGRTVATARVDLGPEGMA